MILEVNLDILNRETDRQEVQSTNPLLLEGIHMEVKLSFNVRVCLMWRKCYYCNAAFTVVAKWIRFVKNTSNPYYEQNVHRICVEIDLRCRFLACQFFCRFSGNAGDFPHRLEWGEDQIEPFYISVCNISSQNTQFDSLMMKRIGCKISILESQTVHKSLGKAPATPFQLPDLSRFAKTCLPSDN